MKTLPLNTLNYVKGLMCIFENASCVVLSLINKCSHDSLTRVLSDKGLCWQTLLTNLIMRTFEKLRVGYLVIDDTTISKRFAASIENLSFVFDTKLGKSILGLQLVLIIWSNGEVAIPLALRVYQKNTGKTKIDLACELIEHAKKLGIKPEFITFDCWYAAEKFLLTKLNFQGA